MVKSEMLVYSSDRYKSDIDKYSIICVMKQCHKSRTNVKLEPSEFPVDLYIHAINMTCINVLNNTGYYRKNI